MLGGPSTHTCGAQICLRFLSPLHKRRRVRRLRKVKGAHIWWCVSHAWWTVYTHLWCANLSSFSPTTAKNAAVSGVLEKFLCVSEHMARHRRTAVKQSSAHTYTCCTRCVVVRRLHVRWLQQQQHNNSWSCEKRTKTKPARPGTSH